MLWTIGVSFESTATVAHLTEVVVQPLAHSIVEQGVGIYSNHLRQPTGRSLDGEAVVEHLLVFEVRDFQAGLRHVRTSLEDFVHSSDMRFHNLTDNQPLY